MIDHERYMAAPSPGVTVGFVAQFPEELVMFGDMIGSDGQNHILRVWPIRRGSTLLPSRLRQV
jgi:hypothetical protein